MELKVLEQFEEWLEEQQKSMRRKLNWSLENTPEEKDTINIMQGQIFAFGRAITKLKSILN